jgi:hypothetical protein
MFTHFSFQIFTEGGADGVPLAVPSSIEATPTSEIDRADHWYFATPVLLSAGLSVSSLYGEFCSRPQEAVSMYKEMWSRRILNLQLFFRQWKKKGTGKECILFVTQRITNYPLLIDPLINTSREQTEECLKLQQVLGFVKVSFSLYLT